MNFAFSLVKAINYSLLLQYASWKKDILIWQVQTENSPIFLFHLLLYCSI